MSSTPTLLVYDDAIETSEVLAAVYQPRGYEVRRLTPRDDSAGGYDYHGAVVVLSSDSEPSERSQAPLRVLIGRVDEAPHCDARHVAACRLSSLFDYRELVGAIDRILCGTD